MSLRVRMSYGYQYDVRPDFALASVHYRVTLHVYQGNKPITHRKCFSSREGNSTPSLNHPAPSGLEPSSLPSQIGLSKKISIIYLEMRRSQKFDFLDL